MVLSMERWKNKVAVVIGASAGIGAAIAEKLVENGVEVAGLARRKEKVEELANKIQGKPVKLHAVQADITKEEDVIAAFKWIKNNLGPVHILVNNAGVARCTTLIEGDTKYWREILDTNILGLCMCTREAVKDMRANDVAGHIVHINSLAGHIVPKIYCMNVYAASKFAVTALRETLTLELNAIGSKIKVTNVSPGAVATEFIETSVIATGRELPEEMKKKISSSPRMQATDIADAVLYTLSTPPHVQVLDLIISPVGEIV